MDITVASQLEPCSVAFTPPGGRLGSPRSRWEWFMLYETIPGNEKAPFSVVSELHRRMAKG